jgi:DNA (cytosine-5)-methyltransferase 1
MSLVVDSFAGGGGASLGIAWALGCPPHIAINHDANAIAMHAANHPSTEHVLEDVWKADLRKLVGKKKVGLLWLSPDCKHFSRAKGAKPVEKSIRSLAWIAVKWAKQVKPSVIVLENVREFEDWGPLVPVLECRECDWSGTEGQATLCRTRRKCPRCESLKLKQTDRQLPDPLKKGLTFKRFIGRLKALGYHVEWKHLNAADYGAPTHRRRLFMIARRDGQLIFWPEATHGDPKKLLPGQKPYRTAAECIDWSIECPSIFTRKRPLAEKTMRRIALGIKRYVIDNPNPYIVQTSHTGTTGRGSYCWTADEPTRTISQSNDFAVVTPIVSKYHGQKTDSDSRCAEPDQPFATLDTQPRFAVVAPTMVPITHNGERKPINPSEPLPTITTAHRGEIGLVTAFIAKHFGGQVGASAETPLPTTTMRGTQNQVVAANLIHLNHGAKQWSSVDEPARTVTSSGQHAALVYSFLTKYFGTAIGSDLKDAAPTATSKDRCGLVTVTIAGEPYVIVDIGMRMLTPRELARAQGFPDTYLLTGTKTSQVARIGNSVCPQVAQAIVFANCRNVTSRKGKKLCQV